MHLHLKHRLTRMLAMGLMLVISGLAFAQPATNDGWYTLLYNTSRGELLRVNGDGTTDTYSLGLGENVFVSGFDLALASDGNTLAFCATITVDMNTSEQQYALFVRDLNAGQNLFSLEMGRAVGCRTGKYAFSPDGTQVSVSIIPRFPDPSTTIIIPEWRLLIVDLTSGTIAQELTHEAPSVSAAGLDQVQGILMPDVRGYSANGVYFTVMYWFSDGGDETPAFEWTFADDSLIEMPEYGYLTLNRLNTANGEERAYLGFDETIPAADPGGPLPYRNVVRYSVDGGEYATIYQDSEHVLLDAEFINDGNALAVHLLDGFDPNDEMGSAEPTTWIALGRDGSLTEIAPPATSGYRALNAAPGGFILLTQESNADFTQQTYTLAYTANGQTQTLWTAAESMDMGLWELFWVSPVDTSQASFPAFPVK